MTQQAQPVINISELYQAGIVVRDLEQSIERYEKFFGIGPWETMECNSQSISDMTYHGQKVDHTFRAAFANVGSVQIELIQPLEGNTIYKDFLDKHGEGLHHLGHLRVDDIDETIRNFEKAGFPCLQSGRFGGGGYAYMDTVGALGTILELLELPGGAPAPGRE